MPPAPSETYTLSLHDALPIYVGFRSSDPSLLYVTPERFLGRTLEEVLPEKVARQAREGLEKALSTGQIQRYDYDLDRKSTRLNSSHPSLSYAVFCLKKKNTYR